MDGRDRGPRWGLGLLLLAVLPAMPSRPASAAEAAQPADSLVVSQVVQLALQNAPAIRLAQADWAAARASIGTARSAYYPQLSFRGDYTRVGPVPSLTIPEMGSFVLAPRNNYDIHLALDATMLDFGRRRGALDAARATSRSLEEDLARVRLQVGYGAIRAFLTALLHQRQIGVLEEERTSLDAHVDQVRTELQTGSATDFELMTSRVRVAQAESRIAQARQNLELQRIELRRLTGLPRTAPLAVRGSFVLHQVPGNIDSLVALALGTSPEIRSANEQIAAARARLRQATAERRPTLGLFATSGYKNGYIPDLNEWTANFTAGAQLQMPLFTGFRIRSREDNARASLRAAQAGLDEMKRNVTASVEEALAALATSLDVLATAEVGLQQAQLAVEVARVRFAAGVVSNLDLLDAETSLAEAQQSRLSALYQNEIAWNALDQAIGRATW
jgi:outer membrane protein